jgi:hypothetical protein
MGAESPTVQTAFRTWRFARPGGEAPMQVLHLTEDADGVWHSSDLPVPLRAGAFAPPAPPMPISNTEAATGLPYLILPAGRGSAGHPSPRRQPAFCLSGRARVEAGDGAIWRMEDVSGSGHTTTALGEEVVRLAIVQLPPRAGDPAKGAQACLR